MKQTKDQAREQSRTAAARVERLTRDLSEIHKLVDEGCAEIAATAQMALKWLESPEGYQELDVVAEALKTIHHSALFTGDCSRSKAITAGSTWRNMGHRRLREAEKAADEARAARALLNSGA